MRNKLIIIIVVVLIGGAALSYVFYLNQGSKGQTETVQVEEQEGAELTVEEFAMKLEVAVDASDTDQVWAMMHPDEKMRWRSAEEYDNVFRRHNQEGDASWQVLEQFVSRVEDVTFTHPVTQKTYENAKRVVIEKTTDEGGFIDTYTRGTYYTRVGDEWTFFSSLISNQDRENMIIDEFQPIDYRLLEKEPGKYVGEKVVYTGKISQISESDGVGFLLMDVTKDEYDWWDDSIYVTYSTTTSAVEEDIITVYGHISEPNTYESVAGWQITVPAITAWAIKEE